MHTRRVYYLVGLAAVLAAELAAIPTGRAAAGPVPHSTHTVRPTPVQTDRQDLAASPAAQAGAEARAAVHVVRPGKSIQAAVDSAKPGDTVVVRPGTYRESVQISTSRLTLTGEGPGTVIRPKDGDDANACAAAGNALCVTGTAEHPVTDVNIRSLTVSGAAKDGIWGSDTDRMDVRGVVAEKNGEQGIAQQKSTRGVFRGNTSRNNAESGIFLANTVDSEGGAIDTKGAVIQGNRLTGNRMGVVIRRARTLTVDRNAVSGNCGGVFIVGDESKPRAGDLTVRDNAVLANNKHCPATQRLPFIQGVGILLTGAEETVVEGNEVRDNTGTSPMSGGVVLYTSAVGAPNVGNTVRDNLLTGNQPSDIADRDTTAGATGNTFTGNSCAVSEPAGRCGEAAAQ
jgi:nitrous oxidase accessory protein NosD